MQTLKKELIQENIKYLIECYGFVNPKNVKVTAEKFAWHIADVFTMEHERNRAAITMLSMIKDRTFIFYHDGRVKVGVKK